MRTRSSVRGPLPACGRLPWPRTRAPVGRGSWAGRAVGLIAAAVFAAALPPATAGEKKGPPAGDAAAQDPSPREDCCFNNRAFSGVCVVKPAEDETCATILAYLNNPRSQGKDYCGKTAIRGGWQQTACEVPQSGGEVEPPRR
jgi:hypothetical protein